MRRFKTVLTLTAACCFFVCASLSASAADRVSARVSEPVEFNGKLYPAGLVQIKEIRNYSPGSTLNEVRVGGEAVGMVLARTVDGASQADRPALLFTRNVQGTLVLEGVSMRNQAERRFMAFRAVNGQGEWYFPRPEPSSVVAARR